MKTAFVVPGRAPAWINDQLRYEANRLTDDGRVLVAFTHRPQCGVRLPGQVGDSTLFGIAPNGYPLWTGRTMAALGMRRRHDRVVIVMFEGAVTALAILAALVAKMRREHVVVHDMRPADVSRHPMRRLGNAVLTSLADKRVESAPSDSGTGTMVFGVCHDDPQLAQLMLEVSSAVPAEAADHWRFVIQSDDPTVHAAAHNSAHRDFVSVVPGPLADDLL